MNNNLQTLSEDRIKRDFFMTDVVDLAQKLLGKKIVRIIDGKYIICRIVETEAYKAPEDKACHAYNNKKTEKTKFFWQIGGNLYVYSIYGNNMCMNITASDADKPEAVLIRAVEPIRGIEIIKKLRKFENKKETPGNLKTLTDGPGKTGASLDIDKSFNGVDLTNSDKIFLVDDEEYKFEVGVSKRINIDYDEEWKDKLWRFYVLNNVFVSKAPKK
jgi:DNA-3-methyladenine glycosylase